MFSHDSNPTGFGAPRLMSRRIPPWLAALAILLAGIGMVSFFEWLAIPRVNVADTSRDVPSSDRGAWGFSLAPSLIPLAQIVPSPVRKDGIPALTLPDAVPAARADFLSSATEVLGMVAGGQARAYPLPVLIWHECINDELGGEPILISYDPLCAAAIAFSRRVEGEVLEFGLSGLLYNSHGLMYDRRTDPHQESLWSRLWMRAVTGPAAAAGRKLAWLDCEVTTWGRWLVAHPRSDVMTHETGYGVQYGPNPFKSYWTGEKLWYPARWKGEDRPDLRPMDLLHIVGVGNGMRAYPVKDLKSAQGTLQDVLGGVPIELIDDKGAGSLTIRTRDGRPLPGLRRATALWFAWRATYPQGEVYRGSISTPHPAASAKTAR